MTISSQIPAMASFSKKRKHNTLSLQTKWEIIQRFEAGESSSILCTEYNIGRSTIHDIKANREAIWNFMKTVSGDRKTMRKSERPELDERMYAWYDQEKTKRQVSGKELKMKMKELSHQLYGKDDYEPSEGALDKFKKRYGIRLSSTNASTEATELGVAPIQLVEVTVDFVQKFLNVVAERGLHPNQVYFGYLGSLKCFGFPSGVDALSQMMTRRKMKDEEFIFMPCISSSGKHKLDLVILSKTSASQLPFSPENLPIHYLESETPQMNSSSFHEWYLTKFVPSVLGNLKEQRLPQKALLVVGNCVSHPEEEELVVKTRDGYVEVMFMPAKGCHTQFSDLGDTIARAIISFYRKRLLMDMASKPDLETTVETYDVGDALLNVSLAWEHIMSTSCTLVTTLNQMWSQIGMKLDPLCTKQVDQSEEEIKTAIRSVCSSLSALKELPKSPDITKELQFWIEAEDYNVSNNQLAVTASEIANAPDVPMPNPIPEVGKPGPSSFTVPTHDALSAINLILKWTEERKVDPKQRLVLKDIQGKVLLELFRQTGMHE